MKQGKSVVWIVVILIIAILVGLIVYWQYRMYVQRKNIEKIEDEIMNGAFPGSGN